MINQDFFESMSSLGVLNLSYNRSLWIVSPGISKLVSLQLLDLSWTSISELPEDLKALVNLTCLNLEYRTSNVRKIPGKLISEFGNFLFLVFGNHHSLTKKILYKISKRKQN